MKEDKLDRVLAILYENGGRSVSGESIAHELGVSRAYVWKLVRELNDRGCTISGASRRGYALKDCSELYRGAVQALLGEGIRAEVHSELDSTNSYLKRLAQAGEPGDVVAAAHRQTGGRGRLAGRVFHSPAGTGLYFSLLCHPHLNMEQAQRTTIAAAVAGARAIEANTPHRALIKWVNDLFVEGRKVCGILTEAGTGVESGSLSYLVVGWGFNLTTRFTGDLAKTAGSIGSVDKNRFAADVVNGFLRLLDSPDAAVAEYRARSLLIGKDIVVTQGETQFAARAVDIDGEGGLVIERGCARQTLRFGEASLKLEQS